MHDDQACHIDNNTIFTFCTCYRHIQWAIYTSYVPCWRAMFGVNVIMCKFLFYLYRNHDLHYMYRNSIFEVFPSLPFANHHWLILISNYVFCSIMVLLLLQLITWCSDLLPVTPAAKTCHNAITCCMATGSYYNAVVKLWQHLLQCCCHMQQCCCCQLCIECSSVCLCCLSGTALLPSILCSCSPTCTSHGHYTRGVLEDFLPGCTIKMVWWPDEWVFVQGPTATPKYVCMCPTLCNVMLSTLEFIGVPGRKCTQKACSLKSASP